jgi:hypothetical protein
MREDVKQEDKNKKTKRYAISVSARTYDRMRSTVHSSLARFVNEIMTSALDDPAILARLAAKCDRKDRP